MMKKIFSVIFAVFMILSVFSVTAFALSGDVDADGSITAGDARLALRCSVELEELSEDAVKRADMDSDGRVTASDARYILRMSVGLEEAPSVNEYEIMRSGKFYIKGAITSDGICFDNINVAVTEDSVYMTSNFEGVEMSMLIKDEKVYMIYDEKEAVLHLSKLLMSMAGISAEELLDDSMMDFSSYPEFSSLEPVRTEQYDSKECTVYSFTVENEQIEIFMCEDELVKMDDYTADGAFMGSTVIDEISTEVPEEFTGFPSSYKLYTGMNGMLTFMELIEF